jgi:hypothetical protein
MALGAELIGIVMLAVRLVATAVQSVASTGPPTPPPAVVQPQAVAEPTLSDLPLADGLE